jgi:hypothetical protein
LFCRFFLATKIFLQEEAAETTNQKEEKGKTQSLIKPEKQENMPEFFSLLFFLNMNASSKPFTRRMIGIRTGIRSHCLEDTANKMTFRVEFYKKVMNNDQAMLR